jgi:hypothetical protein
MQTHWHMCKEITVNTTLVGFNNTVYNKNIDSEFTLILNQRNPNDM